MNIVISGLTAAGKTTHALLLANWLGYDYFSASHLMLSRLGVTARANNSTWTTMFQQLEQMRDARPTDEETNALLREEFERRSSTVFDSWALPWVVSGPCVRVWIESTLESRARKARVSQEPYGPFLSIDECAELLERKDNTTADRLAPLIGADIRQDRSVFEVVLDNSALISAPAISAARVGIARFHDQLCRSILPHLDSSADDADLNGEGDTPIY
jgi:cytidylate kinase